MTNGFLISDLISNMVVTFFINTAFTNAVLSINFLVQNANINAAFSYQFGLQTISPINIYTDSQIVGEYTNLYINFSAAIPIQPVYDTTTNLTF